MWCSKQRCIKLRLHAHTSMSSDVDVDAVYVLQTSFTSASSNLCTRYPQHVQTGTDSFSADTFASPVTCFRPDAAMLTQQVPCNDETGTDLESSLEGIAASAALFESLAGSSVMLDLYDVFANPSAFPFPPEVGGEHVTATSSAATPMDMDVVPPTEYGFMSPATCQPEVFTSSTGTCSAVPEHQLTMSGTSGGQSLEQFEMKVDAKTLPNHQMSQCHSQASHQSMDVSDFCTTAGNDNIQLTSPSFRYSSSCTG